MKKTILAFIVIFIIGFIIFYPSFSLALFGDDWLAFFRYMQHLSPKSSGEWNIFTYYLTPYGAQDIIMGLLYKIIGLNSTFYYLTSFILRILAAISLFPLVFYLTKNKLAAFFASLFFSITVVGLDATNWVFNMPSYITISLLSFFLYFFLSAREQNSKKRLIISAVLYYFAYVTTPIRMHGSLPFIFSLEAFWVFQEKDIKTLKKAAFRFALILGIFLVIRYTGHSQGPAQEAGERFIIGIKAMSQMLEASRFDFLFYPIIMFGSMVIPDFIISSSQIISKSKLLWSALVPSFLGFLVISALLLKDIPVAKIGFFKKVIIAAFFWMIIVILTNRANLVTFNDGRYILLLLIGGFSIILIFFLFLKFFKQKNISTALFLGLSWSILSFFFAWWWAPTSIFPTTYRYLIVSIVGVSVLLATIISLGREKKQQLALFITFCLILILHIISTRIYINALMGSHGQDISNKIWSTFPRIEELGKTRQPLIFYFEGDNTNGTILHDIITFGFPPHMALLYNIREEDGGIPIPMSDPKELVSAITDGKAAKAYGYPEKPIPVDRIYGFKLQGRDNLINVTDQLRKQLLEIKSNAQIQ